MGKQRQEQGKWTSRDRNRENGQAETGIGKMDQISKSGEDTFLKTL